MREDRTAALKPGAIARILETDSVTPPTRRAIKARLEGLQNAPLRTFLDPTAHAILVAVCNRLIPQEDEDRRIDLAARLDARLAQGVGDGWRYDVLPPDREAMARGIAGINKTAQALFGHPFTALDPGRQDTVLSAVQDGTAAGDVWADMASNRFFEELLAAVTEIYYAHPFAQEDIGYVGMADAKGFHALGLNARDPVEQEASLAPL